MPKDKHTDMLIAILCTWYDGEMQSNKQKLKTNVVVVYDIK